MKLINFLLTVSFLVLVLLGCDWGINSIRGSGTNDITYYSKEVEYSTYVDSDGYDLQPVESRIYGEGGKLSIIFKYFYADQESSGYYANDKTEVYEVGDDGQLTLLEYYKYVYQRDDYEYIDEEGAGISTFDYILNRGETYSPDDTLVLYYDVLYEVWPLAYDNYTSIIDYQASSPPKEIARQESTYIADGGGEERYRTEKFYDLADPNDASVSLAREFASWYDSADPYEYLYELYHSIRSTDGSDEYYYYTLYSRNDNGDIYEQADFIYDETVVPLIPTDGDGSFTVTPANPEPFVYNIEFDAIKTKATVLNTEYDSLGNIIRDERSLNGQLSEYTTYTYNHSSELTDQSRYTQGGSLLYDRISLQYKEEYRDRVYYRIKEESTFKYYDYENSRSLQTINIHKMKQNVYRKIINHHHR